MFYFLWKQNENVNGNNDKKLCHLICFLTKASLSLKFITPLDQVNITKKISRILNYLQLR